MYLGSKLDYAYSLCVDDGFWFLDLVHGVPVVLLFENARRVTLREEFTPDSFLHCDLRLIRLSHTSILSELTQETGACLFASCNF